MPLAAVCGSVLLLNRACSALLDGSSVLVGGAPGSGGRRLKSGGITSGALVVTANSSGDFLVRPAALGKPSQPASKEAQRPIIRAVFTPLEWNSLILKPLGPAPATHPAGA